MPEKQHEYLQEEKGPRITEDIDVRVKEAEIITNNNKNPVEGEIVIERMPSEGNKLKNEFHHWNCCYRY